MLGHAREFLVPASLHEQVVEHARRKLGGEYHPDEEQLPKAYGLLGGRVGGSCLSVTHVFPLRRNLRNEPQFKADMDRILEESAVPSETPFERRGWVAAPDEVMAAEEACAAAGSVLVGGYHMHRVPWRHDPKRDTCTALDARLAGGSGLWMLILSMVEPDRPVLRAFFEGQNEQEAAVRIVATDPQAPGTER